MFITSLSILVATLFTRGLYIWGSFWFHVGHELGTIYELLVQGLI